MTRIDVSKTLNSIIDSKYEPGIRGKEAQRIIKDKCERYRRIIVVDLYAGHICRAVINGY